MAKYTELEYQIYLRVLSALREEDAQWHLRSRLEQFTEYTDEQIDKICALADYEDLAKQFQDKRDWDTASDDDIWAWILDDYIDDYAEDLLESEDDEDE